MVLISRYAGWHSNDRWPLSSDGEGTAVVDVPPNSVIYCALWDHFKVLFINFWTTLKICQANWTILINWRKFNFLPPFTHNNPTVRNRATSRSGRCVTSSWHSTDFYKLLNVFHARKLPTVNASQPRRRIVIIKIDSRTDYLAHEGEAVNIHQMGL